VDRDASVQWWRPLPRGSAVHAEREKASCSKETTPPAKQLHTFGTRAQGVVATPLKIRSVNCPKLIGDSIHWEFEELHVLPTLLLPP
jgi:hypothetical protein